MITGITIGIIGTLAVEAALFGFVIWYHWPSPMLNEEDDL